MADTLKQTSQSEMRLIFHKVYYDEIVPLMKYYEKQRQYELFKIALLEIFLITVFCICLSSFFKGKIPDGIEVFVLLGFIFLFLLIICLPFYKNDKFAKMLKQNCMDKVLKTFGDIQWTPDNYVLSDEKLRKSDLFSIYNTRNTDDSFKGSYKGVKFSVCETNLMYITGSGKNKSVQTVFYGVVINFKANKNIKNKTIIASKGDNNIKGKNFVVWSTILIIAAQAFTDLSVWWFYVGIAVIVAAIAFCIIKFTSKDEEMLNEIKLEDPVFNKKYKAYSSDEVEGRYLITTAFMERFNNVKTAFGAKKIKCSFYDEYLMFAISTTKNLFEIGNLFTPLNNPKQLDKFFDELNSIHKMIDYFKLDEKIGL